MRQQARGADTEDVYNHIRFRDKQETVSGTWNSDQEEFLALIGTTNGTGPAFLVIDHGKALQIKQIVSIDLKTSWDTTYYFG